MKYRKNIFYIGILSLSILGGCSERDNPLQKAHPIKTAWEIYSMKIEGVDECAPVFAFPSKASSMEIETCEKLLQPVAEGLNAKNYTDEKIYPENLKLPTMWQLYTRRHLRVK